MNSINLTGRILQLTNKGKFSLGVLGVYGGRNKDTGYPIYDDVPFLINNSITVHKGDAIGLTGRLHSYGGDYGNDKLQVVVSHVDFLNNASMNKTNPEQSEDPTEAINKLDFDNLSKQMNEAND